MAEAEGSVEEAEEGPAVDGGRLRRRLVVALVVLTALLTFVSTIGVWGRGVLLNTDRWVATVGPLAHEEALTDALAVYLVDQAAAAVDLEAVAAEALPDQASGLAVPLASAVRGFLTEQAERLLASDAFATAWVEANRVAHREVVRLLRGEDGAVAANDGVVTLNLLPVLVRLLDRVEPFGVLPDGYQTPDIDRSTPPDEAIATLSTELGRDLPDDFAQIEVFDSDTLAQAQDGVRILDRVVVLLVLLTVGLAVAAAVLSSDRRRTALQLGLGIVIALVLSGAVLTATTDYVVSLISDQTDRSAAASVMAQVLDSLQQIQRVALVVGLLLVVGAWAAGDRARALPVRRHLDALRLAGVGLALLVLARNEVTFASVVATAIGLGAYLGVLQLLAARSADGDGASPAPVAIGQAGGHERPPS